MMAYFSTSCLSSSSTASLIFCAPCEPPSTRTTSTFSSILRNSRAPAVIGLEISLRTGLPVYATFSAGKYFAASLYETAILEANFPAQIFTLPATVSDSCITTGMRKSFAAKSTGKLV